MDENPEVDVGGVLALAVDKPFCWHLPMGGQPESTDDVLTGLHHAD